MGRRCSVGWVKAPLRGLGGSRSRGLARAPLATAGRGAVGWCGPPWQPQGPRLGADPLDASAIAVGVRGLLESVGRGPEGGTGRSHVVKLNPTVLENVCHTTCGQPAAWDGSHARQWSGRPGAAVSGRLVSWQELAAAAGCTPLLHAVQSGFGDVCRKEG